MTQISDLQQRIGEVNEKSGFNEYASIPDKYKHFYVGTKAMLMVSELAEAYEEVRNGKAVTETYYPAGPVPTSFAVEFSSGAEATEAWEAAHAAKDGPKKPEGLPSELADAVIRAFSLAYELDIDLESIIYEKVAYNATRPFRHGKIV